MANRTTMLAAALVLAAVTSTAVAGGSGGRTIRAGNSYEFHFDGKPSTGYQWVLNKAASTGLDVVTVKSLGYGNPYTRMLGSDAPFSFRLTCTGSGFAELRFDYISPDGKTVGATHTHHARCE